LRIGKIALRAARREFSDRVETSQARTGWLFAMLRKRKILRNVSLAPEVDFPVHSPTFLIKRPSICDWQKGRFSVAMLCEIGLPLVGHLRNVNEAL
jgi:hypothetical protein